MRKRRHTGQIARCCWCMRVQPCTASCSWLSCLSRQVSQGQCFAPGSVHPVVSLASRGWSIRAAPELLAAPAGATCLEQHRWRSAAGTWCLWEYELAAHSGPGKQCLDVSWWESTGKKYIDFSITTHTDLYHQHCITRRLGRCWARSARSPCPGTVGIGLCSELEQGEPQEHAPDKGTAAQSHPGPIPAQHPLLPSRATTNAPLPSKD